MKRARLPIPQYELTFVPDTFNLFSEITVDGERIARERAEANHARRMAESKQRTLARLPIRKRTPKRTPKELKPVKPNTAE